MSVRVEKHEGWAEISLAQPERRNALSEESLHELAEAIRTLDRGRDVSAILLRGDGPDFCTGYYGGTGMHSDTATFDGDIAVLERTQQHLFAVMDCHIPVVARLHGRCIAGGTDLAFMCDMVYATRDAQIGFPPTRDVGSPPSPMWLYHVGPQWARRLLLSGDLILGEDAAKIGLVLKALDEEALDREIRALMQRLGRIDRDLLAAQKRSVAIGLELMGARTMLRFGSELDARAHQAPAAAALLDPSATFDPKAIVAKRKENFGTGFLKVDVADETDEHGRLI